MEFSEFFKLWQMILWIRKVFDTKVQSGPKPGTFGYIHPETLLFYSLFFGLSDEAETYKTKKVALHPDALHKSAPTIAPFQYVHLCQEKKIYFFFLFSGIKWVF